MWHVFRTAVIQTGSHETHYEDSHAIYYVIAEWNLYCAVRVGCLKSHLMMELFLPCILILQILLGICMVVKSAFSVRHICLSAHVSVAPTGQISMKFYLQTWLKSYKYIRHFLWRHKYILFFSVTQIYHKSIFVQHSLFLCCWHWHLAQQ